MPATILVVDDDTAIRQLIVEVLVDEGHLTREATNGQEALDAVLGGFIPDLIIVDLRMPLMDGKRCCAELYERGYRIPLLLMTAANEEVEADHLGVAATMSKPFDLDELVSTVERLLDGTSSN